MPNAPTFAEYDRHLAEFERARAVWRKTAEDAGDPIARELALRIERRIADYSFSVRAFLDHVRTTRNPLRSVDVRAHSNRSPEQN